MRATENEETTIISHIFRIWNACASPFYSINNCTSLLTEKGNIICKCLYMAKCLCKCQRKQPKCIWKEEQQQQQKQKHRGSWHTHTKKESESSAIAWIEQAKIKVYISMEHIFHCLLHSHFICTRCTTLYDCSFFCSLDLLKIHHIISLGLWMCAWNIFNGKCKAACMDIW